ncbi:MAG: LacI family transcriptional regulator, partial [Lentisphaerae bacterium]
MKKKATIYDVAQEAGVSHTTVARVLAGYRHISPATRDKVERAIRKLAFVKMEAAANLAKKERISIGLLTPAEEKSFYSLYLLGARKVARELAALGGTLRFYEYRWAPLDEVNTVNAELLE